MIGRAFCQPRKRHLMSGHHGAADGSGGAVNRRGAVVDRRSGGFVGGPAQLNGGIRCGGGLYVRDRQASRRGCGGTAGGTNNSGAAAEP